MSNILDWIKEHVRPYVSFPNKNGDFPINDESRETSSDKIEDKIKDAEVGIRIKWRF